MSSINIITSKTAAETTDKYKLTPTGASYKPLSVPITLYTWDLETGEEIEIQFPTDKTSPNDWETVKILTPDEKMVAFYSPVSFRIKKPVTTAAVGVILTNGE